MSRGAKIIPFPPEYNGVLWQGVDIECNKACNAGLLPKCFLLELKHDFFCFIRENWTYDNSRSKVTTYIANYVRWRVLSWRKQQGQNRLVFIEEGEQGEWGESNGTEYGYSISDVIERAGFTEQEKRIIDAKLANTSNGEIAKAEGLPRKKLIAILKNVKRKLKNFTRDKINGCSETE